MSETRWPERVILALAYSGAFVVLSKYLIDGSAYYQTPLLERPRHPDYWLFKPGGETGHMLGVVGSLLMVLMLLYSLRKRFGFLKRWGQLRWWLHFHIFCGTVGPGLVILHSSFKVQGLVALSFWSMIIVALSGFVGRYLYLQIPRRRSGDELSLEETLALRKELASRLREDFNLSESALEDLNDLALSGVSSRGGVVGALFGVATGSLAVRRQLRLFRKRSGIDDATMLRKFDATLSRQAWLIRRVHLWDQLQGLFHGWHLFHKPFAIIMYVFMALHIAVAIVTGYGGF